MIIRQMPETAVMTVDRLQSDDQLWGYQHDDGSWLLFSAAQLVVAVNPLFTERLAAVCIRDRAEILTMFKDAHVLIRYIEKGRLG